MIKRSFLPFGYVCLFLALALFSCKEQGGDAIERTNTTEKRAIVQTQIALIADRLSLKANGREVLTLDVKSSDPSAEKGAVIYYTSPTQKEPAQLSSRTFSTREAGKYAFYAGYGKDVKSKAVEVEFVRSILTLKSEKSVIKANGKDAVEFTVWQDKEQLSADYEILVAEARDGEYRPIEGKVFTTTKVGECFFIAKYDGFQTEPISIVAQRVNLVLSTDNTALIANGSDKASFTLTEDGRPTEDYVLHHKAPGQDEFVALSTKDYTCTQAGVHTFRACRTTTRATR